MFKKLANFVGEAFMHGFLADKTRVISLMLFRFSWSSGLAKFSCIIYSIKCCSKLFFCRTQKKIFWKMYLCFCFHTMNVYVDYCCFGPHGLSLKVSSFVFWRRKESNVWNNMRKFWQNLHFWVIYAFKVIVQPKMNSHVVLNLYHFFLPLSKKYKF